LVTNLYHLGNKGYYLNFLNNSMVNKWYILGTVQASEYRTKVLISLREKPKTPAILEKEIKIKMSHVSRTLNELLKLGLIKCLNPSLRKGKLFYITKEGIKVHKYLK